MNAKVVLFALAFVLCVSVVAIEGYQWLGRSLAPEWPRMLVAAAFAVFTLSMLLRERRAGSNG